MLDRVDHIPEADRHFRGHHPVEEAVHHFDEDDLHQLVLSAETFTAAVAPAVDRGHPKGHSGIPDHRAEIGAECVRHDPDHEIDTRISLLDQLDWRLVQGYVSQYWSMLAY